MGSDDFFFLKKNPEKEIGSGKCVSTKRLRSRFQMSDDFFFIFFFQKKRLVLENVLARTGSDLVFTRATIFFLFFFFQKREVLGKMSMYVDFLFSCSVLDVLGAVKPFVHGFLNPIPRPPVPFTSTFSSENNIKSQSTPSIQQLFVLPLKTSVSFEESGK